MCCDLQQVWSVGPGHRSLTVAAVAVVAEIRDLQAGNAGSDQVDSQNCSAVQATKILNQRAN
jgi:hypothetical protein